MLIPNIMIALLSGALVGAGIGGGGIAVIYLTAALSLPQSAAQEINLAMYVAAGTAAMSYHIRKSPIDKATVLPSAAAGMLTAYPASLLAAELSPDILRRIFGGIMIISALPILLKLRKNTKSDRRT